MTSSSRSRAASIRCFNGARPHRGREAARPCVDPRTACESSTEPDRIAVGKGRPAARVQHRRARASTEPDRIAVGKSQRASWRRPACRPRFNGARPHRGREAEASREAHRVLRPLQRSPTASRSGSCFSPKGSATTIFSLQRSPTASRSGSARCRFPHGRRRADASTEPDRIAVGKRAAELRRVRRSGRASTEPDRIAVGKAGGIRDEQVYVARRFNGARPHRGREEERVERVEVGGAGEASTEPDRIAVGKVLALQLRCSNDLEASTEPDRVAVGKDRCVTVTDSCQCTL